MNKLTKALLIGSGVAATAAAASCGAVKLLVDCALDREMPKAVPRLQNAFTGGGFGTEEDWISIGAASNTLRGMEHETVELTARDGVKLVGHWFERPDSKRIIIAMHGWRSAWYKDYSLSAPFWMAQGCSILFAEQRGQNDSEFPYIGLGLTERFDCREWAEWADRRCGGELPIYLSGISLGATTVLMAASLPMPKSVHGIVADCGFTSPQEILKFVAGKNLHLPYGLLSGMVSHFFRKKLNVAPDSYSTTQALSETTLPVLLIHGSGDRFVPVEMTYENYNACAGEKRLLIVPGAEHGMSFSRDGESYKNAVLSFWNEFDRKG